MCQQSRSRLRAGPACAGPQRADAGCRGSAGTLSQGFRGEPAPVNKPWASQIGDALSSVNAAGDLLGLFRGVVLPLSGRGVALFSKARPRRLGLPPEPPGGRGRPLCSRGTWPVRSSCLACSGQSSASREGEEPLASLSASMAGPVPGREFPSARHVPVETGAPPLGAQPGRLIREAENRLPRRSPLCADGLTSYRGQRSRSTVGEASLFR